ncbi:MAG: hypothetical protein OSB00_15565 [Sphingomonas bacterium]|nr:hypothetical protein [Sphingomonas bacterium]
MTPFICVRQESITNTAVAATGASHGRRASEGRDLGHCDPERRSLMLAGAPKPVDPARGADPFDVRARIDDATMATNAQRRIGAAIATELLFTVTADALKRTDAVADEDVASPPAEVVDGAAILRRLTIENHWKCEWLDDLPAEKGASSTSNHKLQHRWPALTRIAGEETRRWLEAFDPHKVMAFAGLVLEACVLDKRWRVACWRLDLDERTPHLSVFVVPLRQSLSKTGESKTWVSVRTHLGKRHQLSALQDWAGEVCAPIGLVRGRPWSETGARHVSPSRYRFRALKAAEADLAQREAALLAKEEECEARQNALDARDAAAAAREAADQKRQAAQKLAERELSQKQSLLDQDMDRAANAIHAAAGILKRSPSSGADCSLYRFLSDYLPERPASKADEIQAVLGEWVQRTSRVAQSSPHRTPEKPMLPTLVFDEPELSNNAGVDKARP